MKVLILYNQLFHYRIPIFRLLAEKVDLTVAYSMGKGSKEELNFKTLNLPILKLGRFVIHKSNIFELCSNYDVVIAYGDIAWLSYSLLPFNPFRKYKVIFWSPGVSASYEKKFDAVTKWDTVRDFFYNKADALIFYTDYPLKKYIKRRFNSKKLFVAPNTVSVIDSPISIEKDSLLFIGTLYMQKGILILLENYLLAFEINPNIPSLNIIGGGEDLQLVMDWIDENNLKEKIFVHGSIYDEKVKILFFKRAFACFSPLQAGLSVLESFGYGVPFVTIFDSITGGERLNIINGYNGLLVDKVDDFCGVILEIANLPEKYLTMGLNAKESYENNSRPEHMANGLLNSINFVKD